MLYLSPLSVFRGFDKDNDGCVNVSEWISGLSVFLRGTLEEKMKCKISGYSIALDIRINTSKELPSRLPNLPVKRSVFSLVSLNPPWPLLQSEFKSMIKVEKKLIQRKTKRSWGVVRAEQTCISIYYPC